MGTTDQTLLAVSVAISVVGLAFTIWRIILQRSTLNWLALAAATSITIKSSALLYYGYVLGQSCQARYFFAYFFLNLSKMIVYYLYEQRLALLLQRAKINPFRWILWFFIVYYIGFTAAQIYVNLRDCFVTATGSYTVTSSPVSVCKYMSYALDIAIAATILLGSFVVLGLLIAENARAGIKSSDVYVMILQSDALRFFLVLPVDVYKMYVSMDASGNTGFFPPGSGKGNNGFLQLLDAYKVTVMIFMLVLPGILVQVKAASSKGSGSKLRGKTSSKLGATVGASSGANEKEEIGSKV
ncbi:hypothetical protein DFJ73DRAFT_808677 [Zopfochytrium polystomum]|nr:hypothetical protein DFJ73DRAFT_808677 [Zopfochytrium polystomum]